MKPGNLPVYPNNFINWQLIVGGIEHASPKKRTERKKDFKVFLISSFGLFLSFLNLKITAGRIVAKKNTLRAAMKTILTFHTVYCPHV
jgi:hypothetical protein